MVNIFDVRFNEVGGVVSKNFEQPLLSFEEDLEVLRRWGQMFTRLFSQCLFTQSISEEFLEPKRRFFLALTTNHETGKYEKKYVQII